MPKQLLKIQFDAEGIFRERRNRFLGIVDLPEEHGGAAQAVHVHDPGRLKELLFNGNRVKLTRAARPGRKTAWTLAAARFEEQWVPVNSALHRQISQTLITTPEVSPFGPLQSVTAEVNVGESRLDYKISTSEGETVWVEVKGCTLAVDGRALFPDAPTVRGARHVEELMKLKERGHRAAMLILVFRSDVSCFAPNTETDRHFASTFVRALHMGVEVYPAVLSCSDRGAVCYERMAAICKAAW